MKIVFVFIAVAVAIGAVVIWNFNNTQKEKGGSSNPQSNTVSSSPSPNEKVDMSASFTIVTNGLTRNFTDRKYHNLSPDVYIELPNPSVVYVKKPRVTWNDFFKTLPMELTKECLTTGTKQTFCTGSEGTLRFYLNENEDKDLLDREIKDGDKILIQFSKN